MEHQVIVVSIGPGSPDYLPPIAKRAIDTAAVIVGSQRALTTLAPTAACQKKIDGDLTSVLQFIHHHLTTNDVVVMVSGDAGCYSLLPALRAAFSTDHLTVIPGISSFQLAFARLALPWHNAALISLHGRQPQSEQLTYQAGRRLGILTDPKHHPGHIARLLTKLGWPPDSNVSICANLSYDNEQVDLLTLSAACLLQQHAHCVMVVTAP